MEGLRTIALLGGGQLGRMFIENALRYNVKVHVMDPDPNAPCSLIADRFEVGDLNDTAAVVAFAKDADVVGIEIEHVSVLALDRLKAMGKRVIPDPEVLRTIKDKGLQKQFYSDRSIPTADFALLENPSEIAEHKELLPAFLKLRTGGYDGKGVMAVNGIDAGIVFEGPCVLERRADIALELAVLVARSSGGEVAIYDPVEMVFDPRFNLVDHLRAPARITAEKASEAQHLARRVVDAFNAPGLYAVELFLTRAGELWVNETAPRAHNSGHHTIEACSSSQFDQLLRIYMDWPLGDPTLRGQAAMVNLVGEGGDGEPDLVGMEEILKIPGAFPHLYGKSKTRTGRKMGHVTVSVANDVDLESAIASVKANGKVVPRSHTHSKQ